MNLPREIGPFEILEPLGAGGMGEVFKARDTRLNRFVAIKFLPEHAPALARERFQREAQAIAALNHPHICTLHEVGDDNGRPYLVLELLEGETLRARLRRGALAPELLLDFGLQIADALQAAHAKGVLHRDLKPDNIWVGPGNHIKVLDFGLARLETPEEAAPDDVTLTSPGMTLGTVPYMSPEQARGEPLDARSDLFSFGSVFSEMASGRQPFLRANAAETTAAILKEQPPAPAPDEIGRVIGRLLEKDPDLRYQSAADLRGELKRMKRGSSAVIAGIPALPPRASRGASRWRWAAIAVAVIVVVGGGLAFWRLGPRAPAAVPRLQFRRLTFTGDVVDAVISPDGKFLAHVDAGPLGTSLHLLSIASGSDVQIVPPGNGCCASPSFSPDGGEVYFLQDRVLKSVPVLGGAVRIIAAHACSGAGFSPDGSQIAYVGLAAGGNHGQQIMLARADGSRPGVLLANGYGHSYASQCTGHPGVGHQSHPPAWSPDGRWIAASYFNGKDNELQVINVHSDRTRAFSGPFDGDVSWLPAGSALLATRGDQVWRISFPGGKTTQLTNDLQGYDLVSASSSGELAMLHASPQYSVWVQAKAGGAFQQLPGGGATQDGGAGLTWTPSGGLVSTGVAGAEGGLLSEKADGSHRRLVAPGLDPVVAPNGQIVFDGAGGIERVAADGTGLAVLTDKVRSDLVLTHGGRDVAYIYHSPTSQRLWSVPLAGGAPRQIWSGHVFSDGIAASPNGNRIFAITRGATAQAHVPVIIALNGGHPRITPIAMDFYTMGSPYSWTPDGRAITYVKNQGSVDNIWAFPIHGGKPYAITRFTDLRIAAYAFSKDGRLAISRGTPNSDAVLATGLVKKP